MRLLLFPPKSHHNHIYTVDISVVHMSSRKELKDQLLETAAELRPLEHYIDTVSISIADKAADRTTVLVTNSEVVVQQIGFFSKSLQQQRAKVVTAFENYQQEVRKAVDGALPPLPPILVKGMFLHVNCDLDVFMWLLQYAEATAQRNGILVPLGKTRVKPPRASSPSFSKRASSVEPPSVFPIHPAGYIPLPDLTIDMVVSLALSSRFLQMMDLCAAACEYLCSNLGEVLMSDVNCDCIPEKELIDEIIFGRGMMTTSRLLDGALYVACATRTNLLGIMWSSDAKGSGMLLKGPQLRSYLTDLICKNESLPPQAATTRVVDCPNRAFLTRLLGKLLVSVTNTSNCTTGSSTRTVGFCRHCGLLTTLDPSVIQRCPSLRGDGIGPRGEVKESHEHTDINCMGAGAALDSLFKHFLIPTLDTANKKHRDVQTIATEGPTTYSVSTLGGHILPSRSIAETVEKCRRALHARSSSGPTEKECSGLAHPNPSSCDVIFRQSPALFPLQTFFREGELAAVIILLQIKLVRPSQTSVSLCAATESMTGADREPQELGIPSRRVTLSSTRYAASIMALRHHPLLTTFKDPDGSDNVGCLLEAKLLLPRKLEKYLPNCFSCTITTTTASSSTPTTPTSGAPPPDPASANLFKSMATAGPDAVAISSYVQASRGHFSQMVASRQRKIVAKAERRRHRAANAINEDGSSSSDDMPDYDYEAAGKSPEGPHYETARALVLSNQEKAAYSPAYMLLDLCNMRENRVFRDQSDGGPTGGSFNIPPPTYTVRKAPVGYQRPQSNGIGARPKTSPLIAGEQQPTTPRLGQSVKKTTTSSFRQPRPPGTKR